MDSDNTCKECSEVFNDPEQVRRHLRKHGMTFQQYSLRWHYNGVEPTCKCGCGQKTAWNVASKGYAEFVLGHHAWGRKKSDDEKRRIGEKNAANIKRYMQEHPDVAREKAWKMTVAGMNDESNRKRAESSKRFWSSDSELTHQRRKEASDRAIILLEQNKIGPHAPFRVEQKHNPFTGNEEWMHSSYESAFLDECIKFNTPVTKVHDLVVPYVALDGTNHQYVPDFIDMDDNTVIEVKGYLSETDVIKLNALVSWAQDAQKRVVLWSIHGWETLWSPDPEFQARWDGPLTWSPSTAQPH